MKNIVMLQRTVVSLNTDKNSPGINMSAELFLQFLSEASKHHAIGLKSFGVFLSPLHSSEYSPNNVIFCNSKENRRNSPDNRAVFEAQGAYFRKHDDAGFVADSKDMLHIDETAHHLRSVPVGLFHSHRRQPANFSLVDYKLHNPLFPWHLVISLSDPEHPVVQVFLVEKSFDDFGLEADNFIEDEGELPYDGFEVKTARLLVEGTAQQVDEVKSMLYYNKFYSLAQVNRLSLISDK
ncbi:hypothetical protein Lepto7375DRAFT_1263 [Leptolyngbya sp. PCC 7375]|nr:hypothetical protein Lepto7375DRAFT_1263 [Leptolyngbya sp. PCC 7375]